MGVRYPSAEPAYFSASPLVWSWLSWEARQDRARPLPSVRCVASPREDTAPILAASLRTAASVRAGSIHVERFRPQPMGGEGPPLRLS